MANRIARGGFFNVVMATFLICVVLLGAGLFLIKGQQAASSGVSLRAGILTAQYDALSAQVYGSIMSSATSPAHIIRIEQNPAKPSPLIFSAKAVNQTMGSFVVFNDSSDTIFLRKLKFSVPQKSPISRLGAFLNGNQFGSLISVPQSTITRSVSFSSLNATGMLINPRSSVVLDITGTPLFSRNDNTSPFLTLVDTEIIAQSNMMASGQAVSTVITVPTSTPPVARVITFSKSPDSPVNPPVTVVRGATDVTLAKFTIIATGADWNITSIPIRLMNTGVMPVNSMNGLVGADVSAVRLVDDMNRIVGSSAISSAVRWGGFDGFMNSHLINFGSKNYPLNYTVPMNSSRVISVRADIQPQTTMTGISANLHSAGYANAETIRVSPPVTAYSPIISGNILPVISATPTSTPPTPTSTQTSAIRISKASVAPPSTVPAGTKNVTLGKFVFYGENSSYRITSLPFNVLRWQANGSVAADVTNIRLVDDAGANIGSVIGSPSGTWTSTGAGNQFYYRANFGSASQSLNYLLPANTTRTIMIKGDIATTTTMAAIAVSLMPASYPNFENIDGTPNPTTHPVVYGDPVEITSVSVVTAPTVTISTDSKSPSSRYLVMGSANNELYKIRVTAGNEEDIRVTTILFTDSIANNAAGMASLNNLKLYNVEVVKSQLCEINPADPSCEEDGTTLLAGPVNMNLWNTSMGGISFNFASSTAPDILKGTSRTFIVKSDVATYISGGTKSDSRHTLGLLPENIIAFGKNSGVRATVTGSTNGSAHSVYRTNLHLTASSTIGATTGRSRVVGDDLVNFILRANVADDVRVSTIRIRFSGQAVASSTTPFYVSLIDANTGANWGSSQPMTCTPTVGSQCFVAFSPEYPLSRESSKYIKLRVNSSAFNNVSNTGDPLSATIDTSTDITWYDGTTTSAISLDPFYTTPINLVVVSYE